MSHSTITDATTELIIPVENVSQRIGADGKLMEEPELSKEDSQEARNLKELLLLHLDLVQQQQELLLAKDRRIKVLKQENETLRNRLERIERRMHLNSQRIQQANIVQNTSKSQTGIDVDTSGKGQTNSSAELVVSGKEYPGSSSESNTRKSAVHHRSSKERKCGASSSMSDSTTAVLTEGHSDPMCSSLQQKTDLSSRSSKRRTLGDVSTTSHKRSHHGSVSEETKPEATSDETTMMLTEKVYYVAPYSVHVIQENLGINDEKDDITTPQWQIKPFHAKYIIEGTEDLGDEIYLRMHQKLETEEKRRKRWDLQRLRDMRLLRKQQIKDDKKLHVESDLISFLPEPDKVTHIEVSESLPVSVFGSTLPEIPVREFSLPWHHINERSPKFRKLQDSR